MARSSTGMSSSRGRAQRQVLSDWYLDQAFGQTVVRGVDASGAHRVLGVYWMSHGRIGTLPADKHQTAVWKLGAPSSRGALPPG